uniref:Uncharacterized protein n=1 Tax=Nannospalax galili TaxID=1026970 RepID=A0A8C6QY52_NANGA
ILVQGKVKVADWEESTEVALYLLSLLIFRLQDLPSGMEKLGSEVATLFTHSHVVSLVNAAACLLGQLGHQGVTFDLQPQDWIAAAAHALSGPAEVRLTPPCSCGFYDGLLIFLLQHLYTTMPSAHPPSFFTLVFPTGEFRSVDHSMAPLFHGSEATRGGVCTGRRAVTIQYTQPRARLDTDFTPRYLSLFVRPMYRTPFKRRCLDLG